MVLVSAYADNQITIKTLERVQFFSCINLFLWAHVIEEICWHSLTELLQEVTILISVGLRRVIETPSKQLLSLSVCHSKRSRKSLHGMVANSYL